MMGIDRQVILEFLSRHPGGAEAAAINNYLKGRFLVQTRLMLYGMVEEGLLKTQKIKVEGSRLGVFFKLTPAGRARLRNTTNNCRRELAVA